MTVVEAFPRSPIAADVLRGLSCPHKSLPPYLFYDAAGSALYERITELPEYYPTRTERAILAVHADDVVRRMRAGATRPLTVVELGAGTATKTQLILRGGRARAPPAPAAMDAPPALTAALAAIAAPAYVLDRCWNARAWNAAAAGLFVGWLDGARDGECDGSAPRNLLHYIFRDPPARALIPDWADRARRVVAGFRADHGRHLDDRAMKALADALRAQSPEFAAAWEAHDVVEREGGVRRFAHPRDGALRFEQITFTLAARPEFKLVMLTPLAGAPGREGT